MQEAGRLGLPWNVFLLESEESHSVLDLERLSKRVSRGDGVEEDPVKEDENGEGSSVRKQIYFLWR